MSAKSTESIKLEMIRLCHSSLDSQTLRLELLKRLKVVIPFDYVYFSTTDPATHFATSSVLLETPPPWLMSIFLENEFLQQDFNKFSDMCRSHQPVSALSEATRYDMRQSQRYRDMLVPLAMEDELRAVFVAGGACWGTLCLHRENKKLRYTPAETNFLASLVPHIADGLRKALLLESPLQNETPDGPGVLILADDFSIVTMTAVAAYWLAELIGMEGGERGTLPLTVRSVASGLQALERGLAGADFVPKVRLRTRTGQWLMLYASRLLCTGTPSHISVTMEAARPEELAPLIMQAYQLTRRESEITRCVLQGWLTAEIAARLFISPNTVQDHLKAIFEKVGVNSRGNLRRGYLSSSIYHFQSGSRLDAAGQFIIE
ncbi:MAG: helix-turn-helix transcriptional regulator [Anaerolineae bacterium]